jgi:outer membrane lipoprotein-sorting protein
MISSLALLLATLPARSIAGQASQAPSQSVETGAALLSKMFSRYSKAKTLSSKILMTQTAMNKTLTFQSELCYQRPDKIFFVQKESDNPRYAPKLVSDGVKYYFSAPRNTDNHRISGFTESVHSKEGALTVPELWPNVLSSMEGGDDSFALEAMISRNYSLRQIVTQMESFANKGKIQYGAQLVNDVEGKWRVLNGGQTGTFSMYITDDGDLVRQQTDLRFQVSATFLINHHMPANAFPDGIDVITTWEITTQLDQPVNDGLFRLPTT